MARKDASGLYLISRLQDELNRAISRAGELAEQERPTVEASPPADVIETEEAVVVVIEVPGFAVDELEVETAGSRVTIRGRPREPQPQAGPVHFHCLERRHSNFEHRIELGGPFDTHRANARLALGLLEIEIPKIDDRRSAPRRIEIRCEET